MRCAMSSGLDSPPAVMRALRDLRPGLPVAVNVDPRESNVKCLSKAEMASTFEGTGITVAHSDTDLVGVIEQSRNARSTPIL